MFVKTVATIYFYLISAASLALIVIGIFSSVNFIVNFTQYEKYPAPFFQQFNCEVNPYGPYGPYPVPAPVSPEKTDIVPSQEQENLKRQCEQNEIEVRRQSKINDLKNAITFPLVGLVLFAVHFPIALKRSKGS